MLTTYLNATRCWEITCEELLMSSLLRSCDMLVLTTPPLASSHSFSSTCREPHDMSTNRKVHLKPCSVPWEKFHSRDTCMTCREPHDSHMRIIWYFYISCKYVNYIWSPGPQMEILFIRTCTLCSTAFCLDCGHLVLLCVTLCNIHMYMQHSVTCHYSILWQKYHPRYMYMHMQLGHGYCYTVLHCITSCDILL